MRQTADTVALILAGVVAIVVVLTAVTVVWTSIAHPEQDVAPLVDAIGRIIGVLVGALVGFMAGRRMNGA